MKCLKSVKSIFTFALSAAFITSWSLIEPPGCTIVFIPAFISVFIPSAKGKKASDAATASDAFFPFADGLIAAAKAGVTAIIQPGGSIRDEEVIQAADDAGLAMIFTGLRHFNH